MAKSHHVGTQKLKYGVGIAAIMLTGQLVPAANFTIENNTTTSFAATNGTLGGNLTMGTNGQLVLNGISTDTVNTFTGSFADGGTPNRGTANIRINTDPASLTVLNLTTYGYASNKTDILIEGNNVGGTGPNSSEVKWTTTPPPLFGAAAGITGVNATILVHDLATSGYNLSTYDAATGIRGLSTANPNDYAVNALTPSTNVLLTGSVANGGAVTINSLTLRSAGTGVNLSGSAVNFPTIATAGASGILSDGDTANTISAATISGPAADGLTIHTIADLTISSNITTTWITKANAGTLTLTGNNTITNTANFVSIDGGTLSISSSQNLGASAVLVVLLGGTLQVTASTTFSHALSTYEADTSLNVIQVTGSNVVNFTGGIATRDTTAGTGGVTYSGPGTAIISGVANTGGLIAYSGPTKINGGTVVANINPAITAATSVAGGAKFQINSGLNITTTTATAATVTLSAANSELVIGTTGATGSTSLTGALTGSSGATVDVDFNGVTNATDQFSVSGVVTAGGTWTINLNDLNGASVAGGTVYTLLTGGTFTGTPTLVGNVTSANWALDTTYHGNGLFWDPTAKTLTAEFAPTAVPEPASLSLLALGAVGLLIRRRKV